jgi:hypothetical protein
MRRPSSPPPLYAFMELYLGTGTFYLEQKERKFTRTRTLTLDMQFHAFLPVVAYIYTTLTALCHLHKSHNVPHLQQ